MNPEAHPFISWKENELAAPWNCGTEQAERQPFSRQLLAEPGAGVAELRAGAAFAYLEHIGYLFVGIAFDSVEAEDSTEASWHRVHKSLDLVGTDLFQSVAVRYLHRLGALDVVGELEGVIAAQLHEGGVDEQPAGPALERAVALV